MKVMCNLEGEGFGGVLQNNPQLARTFGNTPPNPDYITFMLRCEMYFMGVRSQFEGDPVSCHP